MAAMAPCARASVQFKSVPLVHLLGVRINVNTLLNDVARPRAVLQLPLHHGARAAAAVGRARRRAFLPVALGLGVLGLAFASRGKGTRNRFLRGWWEADQAGREEKGASENYTTHVDMCCSPFLGVREADDRGGEVERRTSKRAATDGLGQ